MGSLAYLGQARAYALQAADASASPTTKEDSLGKARAAYQQFLTIWKDADPDIPILIAAKAEYSKLH